MKSKLPLIITLIFAGWVAGFLRGPSNAKDGFAVKEFGALPLVNEGRHQPLDSLARNSLLRLRKKQTLNTEPWKGNFDHPKIISATEWLMELMMAPDAADAQPVFRIDSSDVIGLLALPAEAGEANRTDGKHYAWNQIAPRFEALRTETQRATQVKSDLRSAYDRGLVELWTNVNTYKSLKAALGPAATGDLAKGLQDYQANLVKGREAFQAQMNGGQFDRAILDWMQEQLAAPLTIPARDAKSDWTKPIQEIVEIERGATPHSSLVSFAAMAKTYRAKDTAGFAAAVNGYSDSLKLAGQLQKDIGKAKSEQFFNFVEPFYRGMVIAVMAFILAVLVWLSPVSFEWARRSAMWLATLALLITTVGLIFRMVHEGRPPVTNLYSSALFIGWAAAIFGLVLERVFPFSIGVAVSSLLTFGTLLIAHFLALDGDTMIMLRAVLDTNFWLATHVVVVTLGYASTFVAGMIAVSYVVRGFFTAHVSREMSRAFYNMTLAIVCFAALFSFVGTVLGGIWADQSWGRFWGWDPKENGALIIVLWNALVLHARLGGLVRERGLMNLAIFGNIVTSWSWFGVNMLGIGLHSYGFMDSTRVALIIFVVVNLLLIALGSTPLRMWASFRKEETV